eukprot:scaffold113951_cov18-Tisochrysis_lutea.AAC.1
MGRAHASAGLSVLYNANEAVGAALEWRQRLGLQHGQQVQLRTRAQHGVCEGAAWHLQARADCTGGGGQVQHSTGLACASYMQFQRLQHWSDAGG